MRRKEVLSLWASCCWLALPCAHAQEKAATEAEMGWRDSTLVATDPLRSPALAMVGDAPDHVHGAEHMAGFLRQWRHLLEGDTAGRLPLNILHFGGSHVQAGRIGWSFRNALMADRPGVLATRGVVAPHRLAGENGPPDTQWHSPAPWTGQRSAHRRHRGDWGVTGLEVSSSAPDTVQLWCSALDACPDGVHILTRPSESNGWRLADAQAPVHGDTLHLVPPDSGAAHLHGVLFQCDHADVVYHDLGGNGASTAAWLRHPHLKAQLQQTAGDLAILAWGINDAHMPPERFRPERFKARYRQLIDSMRTASPGMEVLLVTNNDSHYRRRHNANAERVRTAMLELVEEMGVACWDLYGALGGAHSIDVLRDGGFAASDHLHFNRNGYVLIGELLYATLTRTAFSLNPQ